MAVINSNTLKNYTKSNIDRAWLRRLLQHKARKQRGFILTTPDNPSDYWRNEIAASSGDSKKLWNVFHAVLGETRTDDTDPHTADEFGTMFA